MIDFKKCETCFFKFHKKYDGYYCEKFTVCNNGDKYKPYTNGDMIRQMDDNRLAEFLCDAFDFACNENCIAHENCRFGHNGFKQWVKEAVKIDW